MEGFWMYKQVAELTVKSPVFQNNQSIPKKYGSEGADTNPPLTIEAIPPKTKTLVLILDDPDAPRHTFVHWVVYNLPPDGIIQENNTHGIVGLNSDRENTYTGMCPPYGTHRYFFKVYALDTELDLPANVTGKAELEKAIQGHILGKGELIGLFRR